LTAKQMTSTQKCPVAYVTGWGRIFSLLSKFYWINIIQHAYRNWQSFADCDWL